MVRWVGLCAVLGTTGFAVSQEASKIFDFKHSAAPMSVVLRELAKVAGAELSASKPVADDVILLNFKSTSLMGALDKIAEAVHGEWRQEDASLVLYRGPNLEGMDARKESAEKIARLKQEIRRLSSIHQAAGAFSVDTANKIAGAEERAVRRSWSPEEGANTYGNTPDLTPSTRAITALLSAMSDIQLAQIVDRNRTVFASQPTRMQSPLPGGSQATVDRYLQDLSLLRNARQQNPPHQKGRKIFLPSMEEAGDGDWLLGQGHTMLIARRKDSWLFLTLMVSDRNGRLFSRTHLSLNFLKNPAKPPTEFKRSANEKAIEISPLTKELVEVLSPSRQPMSRAAVRINGAYMFYVEDLAKPLPLSPELKERILNPDRYDPLGFAPSEAILGASEQLQKNIVAYLPDSAFKSLTKIAVEPNTAPSAFLNSIQTQADLNAKSADNWIVISPRYPSTERRQKANRPALGVALRTLNQNGVLTLDQLAKLAAAQPTAGPICIDYFGLINAPFTRACVDPSDGSTWKTLQLYDTFSLGQKQTAAETGRLPLSGFTSQQLAILSDQVFGEEKGPDVQISHLSGKFSAFEERTIALPNGLTRSGYMEVGRHLREGVQAKFDGWDGTAFFATEMLAIVNSIVNAPGVSEDLVRPRRFRLAQRREFTLTFMFTPQTSMTQNLIDMPTSNIPFVAFDQLPEEFRQKAAAGQGG